MTELRIEPLHEDFGARVTGIALSGDLTADEVAAVRAAIDTYSVLLFPDQDMSDEKHLAFTRLLGEPEVNHGVYGATGRIAYLATIGNVKDDGTKRGGDDPHTRHQTGNNMWHSDSSFREVPSFVSILHAYEVPDEGGETAFVSQRAAYARLPEEMQARIEPLRVLHDYVFSRSKVAPVNANHAASIPPVTHRLVKTNPANGRKNYFVGSHARAIPGLHGVEARELIDGLLERATRPQDIWTQRWRAGDTLIWDNRCILHRGLGYDAERYRRYMRQTRVTGAEKGTLPS
jgi:alpha-ketoglutarate-dependent 2,4-dichlorophenoxyacetate dioxygenase